MTSPSAPGHDRPVPLRVLVVDDQPAFRTTVALVLAHVPELEVVAEAPSGEAALALLDAGLDVHVALIDVHMPGIDGATTARILTERHGDVVVVLTSTYAAHELPSSVSTSAFPYLPKDEFDPDHLVRWWEEHRRARP